MLFLAILVVFSLVCIKRVDSQPTSGPTYCTRANGLYNVSDGGIACMQSGSVANCCFTCQITGPSPYNARCGSLYNFGATSCNNIAATNAAMAACGGTSFTCQCNTGPDQSQIMGTSPPSGGSVTPAPTNDGHHHHSVSLVTVTLVLSTFVLFLSSY